MTSEPFAANKRPRTSIAGDRHVVAGVRISHPDRVIYPDPPITKHTLATYYANIAGWIVPHVAGRPLTLVHCPAGISAPCHYMKHSRLWGPKLIRRVRIQEKTKIGDYLVADDITAVVALVQMGIVEIHTWNSTTDDVERPDRIVWDLDPGPSVTWPHVVAAAHDVRSVLHVLGIETWVKTTGGRGLHVVAPIVPRLDWSECLVFARTLAEVLSRNNPTRYTTKFAKTGRESKILIDYLRNNRTNTSIAAFSSRARAGAPVSMPLAWTDLTPRLRVERFTVVTVPPTLRKRRRDPWSEYWTIRQRVGQTAIRALTRL